MSTPRPPVVAALDALFAERAGEAYAWTRATPIELGPRAGLWFSLCPLCGSSLHAGERDGAEVLLCGGGCSGTAIEARMVSELAGRSL